jgi:hypothetical protein
MQRSNSGLSPESMTSRDARELLATYTKVQRLAAFGIAALTRKLSDAEDVAGITGTSVGQAKATIETGRAIEAVPELGAACREGGLSLEQASEIAKAATVVPEKTNELVKVAREQSFGVLRERARAARLEALQSQGLAEAQRKARFGRSHNDELGMVHIHLALEPHVGTPIVARAEAEAQRQARAARQAMQHEQTERFEHHLADAYASLMTGSGQGPTKRPELVVLVSHGIAKRGWKDVRANEVCKIPGIGPVAPTVAREIVEDAFLSGIFFDGKDLRQVKRWNRSIPPEVRTALELGDPPAFDGVRCVDCGKRFRNEIDHVRPVCEGGPTSHRNLKFRCWRCHQAKSERERRARARPERARRAASIPKQHAGRSP